MQRKWQNIKICIYLHKYLYKYTFLLKAVSTKNIQINTQQASETVEAFRGQVKDVIMVLTSSVM